MTLIYSCKKLFTLQVKFALMLLLVASSCTIYRKAPKDKAFLAKNIIEVKTDNFNRDEKSALKQRLNGQLDDSSRIVTKDAFFIIHTVKKPPIYDSNSAALSIANMKASMRHIGYYRADVHFKADTSKEKVTVKYNVITGKPTLIDTVIYYLRKPDLQTLTANNLDETFLVKDKPVTKATVLGEVNRLVELYRNNGYYKFTSEELRVRGDTTIAALTTISDDPFEQLQLLAEAQAQKDKPKIKLAIVLNPPAEADSNKIKPYYINNIYILPDYIPGDSLSDKTLIERVTNNGVVIKYHSQLFRTNFLAQNMALQKGDLYSQERYYKSLNNFSKAGVWQNSNIQIKEVKDSGNKIDLIVQLIPGKKQTFEAGVEASYSASSSNNNVSAVNAGNLLGLSGNVSILNRNVHKEAIKMSNSLRAGVELNLKPNNASTNNAITATEFSYDNSIVFPRFLIPRFIKPLRTINNDKRILTRETFTNVNAAVVNRLNLFKLNTVGFGVGYSWTNARKNKWVVKPISIEFAKLYNISPSFQTILDTTPFLRYSFNTALVAGSSINFSTTRINKKFKNKEHTLKFNAEESGNILFRPFKNVGIFKQYLKQFVKADIEYIHTISYAKSSLVYRMFLGAGISSKADTTLPFFKQYFAGGINSMRGWPVRGIGRGSQPLTPYNAKIFNDRTGDMQLEANVEYRFDIAQIIPNSFILKGAFFIDAGNIWNLRNSKGPGLVDAAQFKPKNLYKELGVSAGTGVRLDFNYFVVRFDFGFRFKRPELSNINSGWKAPPIGFDDAFKKLFSRNYKQWRYENFNFNIGISYPFL